MTGTIPPPPGVPLQVFWAMAVCSCCGQHPSEPGHEWIVHGEEPGTVGTILHCTAMAGRRRHWWRRLWR